MIKKLLFIFLLCISLYQNKSHAQVTDWSSTVAAIFYENCTICHHEGGIGPFSLIDYEDAVNNGFTIQEQVNAKKMPPWPADPDYNHFWDEKVLSDDDITAINDWVDDGMLPGDLASAPPPPVYDGAVALVNPDDTVFLPHYTIPS